MLTTPSSPEARLTPILAENASGACRITSWAAASTVRACGHPQSSRQVALPTAGRVSKVKETFTPKFPPPPPRQAQNRSGSWSRSQESRVPSAVTTSVETSRSQVRPYARDTTDTPPPRVSPPMPTSSELPSGIASPCFSSAAYSAPPRHRPPRSPILRIVDLDRVERAQVKDEARARRGAGVAVAAAARGQRDTASRAQRTLAPRRRPIEAHSTRPAAVGEALVERGASRVKPGSPGSRSRPDTRRRRLRQPLRRPPSPASSCRPRQRTSSRKSVPEAACRP